MGFSGARLAVLAAMLVALATAGSAAAQENERGIDPNQGRSLVEVNVPDKAAAIELQLDAEKYGIDFNDHYLRTNSDGSVTVTVFGNEDELNALEAAGYELGTTIEGPATWRQRAKDWQADVKAEETAGDAALAEASTEVAPRGDIVVLRVDYFENYAGRFLSVEAKDGTRGSSTTGESLVVAWNSGAGTPIDQGPRTMNVNIDPDTTPDTYIEHRILIKVGELGSATPPAPTQIRIGSSNGTFVEADVNTWLGGGLPPMSSNFLSNFTTRYLDPTELYGRFRELADEFPDLTTIIPLPYKTNGYQRRAQALMAGLTNPAATGNLSAAVGAQAVILTSRAWGHEGGNDLTAEFINPGVANAPLTRELRRQRPQRQAGDERDRCAHEHRRPGGGGDQRQPGVRSRSSSRRPTAATRAPGSSRRGRRATCPTSSRPRRTRTCSAARSSTSCCGSARTGRATAPTRAFTAVASASSCTASSMPASGRRR